VPASFESRYTLPDLLAPVCNTTLPTAAERLGDFSQSLTTAKALRVIFDPTSTLGANRTPRLPN
jgi:hypothetical protein